MAKPGIMIYFDMLGPIRVLPDADKGRLLVAMLEYGQNGTEPQFDGMLALAWEFAKPKLDKDTEEYNRTIMKRQYATFCRDRKKKGEPDISFDEWKMTIDNGNHHMISNDIKWYPTTTTATATETTTATATAAAAYTTTNTNADGGDGDPENNVTVMGGSLGKGVLFLSQEQMDDLLDRMGIETFDYYVDKLSRFIIEKKARVKNHYETILKWWSEDGKI